MSDISIVIGGSGLVGSQIVKSLFDRGDKVVILDTRTVGIKSKEIVAINAQDNNYAEKITSILNSRAFDNFNIIFSQMYEESDYRLINTNGRESFRELVRELWVSADSSDFSKAIKNQIELPDRILRRLNKIIECHSTRILFIGSSFGEYGKLTDYFSKLDSVIFKHPSYGLSKMAIGSYIDFLVDIYHSKPVRINCLALGVVDRGQTDNFALSIKKNTAYRNELISLKDVSNSVSFMLSDESDGIHGQVIQVNKGWFG